MLDIKDFETYVQQVLSQQNDQLPPVELWNPPLSGDIDIVITHTGVWYHEGGEIKRPELVKLFSSILKREGEDYFLVTPVEKWRVRVEDVPFFIVAMDAGEVAGQQVITFNTSVGNNIVLSRENPLRVLVDTVTREPSPYVLVRQGMEGCLNRNTFYQLAQLAEECEIDGEPCYRVSSMGQQFYL